MIKNKLDYNFYLKADSLIAGRNKPSFLTIIFKPDFIDPIGKFMYFLRCSEYLENSEFSLFVFFFKKFILYKYKKLSLKLGFSIPLNVFGPGLFIPHYGTIVINPNVKVGANCVLHTSVCIAGSDKKKIGKNVYISTGVIITGKIEISENITISANSFVNKSFLNSNLLIGGSPAKILKERKPWYIEDGKKFEDRIISIEKK